MFFLISVREHFYYTIVNARNLDCRSSSRKNVSHKNGNYSGSPADHLWQVGEPE